MPAGPLRGVPRRQGLGEPVTGPQVGAGPGNCPAPVASSIPIGRELRSAGVQTA
jgi:hypothetical protein